VRVAVLGLGLIGGSLARRLLPGHEVLGWDADPGTRELAAAAGIRIERDADADVTVVATPMAAVPGVLEGLSDRDRPIVTDVGSLKVPVLAAARRAGLADRYVGGHPMAGTEHAGFAAADPALFDGAAWVLCLEPDTDLGRWLTVADLAIRAGCRVVPATAAAHDAAQARISGLPHLLAAALAVAGDAGGPLAAALAAGSFRDGTRVAGRRPDLLIGLCDGNREALAEVLTETVDRLGAARDALRTGGSVAPLAEAGHAARRRWAEPRETLAVTLRADREELVALGARGGFVAAVGGDGVLHCRVPRVSDEAGAGKPGP
jgi:prephenate dehydrogenase